MHFYWKPSESWQVHGIKFIYSVSAFNSPSLVEVCFLSNKVSSQLPGTIPSYHCAHFSPHNKSGFHARVLSSIEWLPGWSGLVIKNETEKKTPSINNACTLLIVFVKYCDQGIPWLTSACHVSGWTIHCVFNAIPSFTCWLTKGPCRSCNLFSWALGVV